MQFSAYIKKDGHGSVMPVTSMQLSDMEKELGISIPNEYKKFLMDIDGGCPVDGWDDKGDVSIPDIQKFFSLNEISGSNNGALSLRGYYGLFCDDEDLPRKKYLPIATDPGGYLYLIVCDKDDLRYGTILIYEGNGVFSNICNYDNFNSFFNKFIKGYEIEINA